MGYIERSQTRPSPGSTDLYKKVLQTYTIAGLWLGLGRSEVMEKSLDGREKLEECQVGQPGERTSLC